MTTATTTDQTQDAIDRIRDTIPERRTRSGLLILDPKPFVAEGRRQIRDELSSELHRVQEAGDVEAWRALASAAARAAKATDTESEELRPRRDEALLSLYLLDGVRGVDQAAGIAATTFYEMRAKALGLEGGELSDFTRGQQKDLAIWNGLRHVDDADVVIFEVAPRLLVLNGRREEASELQTQAALAMHAAGVPVPEIIDVVGVSEGRFWQWHSARTQNPQARARRRARRARRNTPLAEALGVPVLASSDSKVSNLGLQARTRAALERKGIRTVGDLVARSENDLREVPRVGDSAIREITQAVTLAAAS